MYSWKDKEFAIPLSKKLRSKGFDVSLDIDEIAPGDFVADRVTSLVEEAESIVFLVSPESLSSEWCRWEIAIMQERDMRVVPVLLKSVDPDSVPDYVSRLNYVVMTDSADSAAFDTLVRALHAGRGLSWSERGDRIFLSYRREDTEHVSGRIYDHLEREFGGENVFFDIEDIKFGEDFRGSIKQAIIESRVLVAVAGRRWFRRRLLQLPSVRSQKIDWVRIELEQAIDLSVKIIPVLVDGLKMPNRRALPRSVSQISYLNAAPVRAGRDFRTDIERVISRIRDLRKELEAPNATPPSSPDAG